LRLEPGDDLAGEEPHRAQDLLGAEVAEGEDADEVVSAGDVEEMLDVLEYRLRRAGVDAAGRKRGVEVASTRGCDAHGTVRVIRVELGVGDARNLNRLGVRFRYEDMTAAAKARRHYVTVEPRRVGLVFGIGSAVLLHGSRRLFQRCAGEAE